MLRLLKRLERDLTGALGGAALDWRSLFETVEAASDLSDRLLENTAARRRMLWLVGQGRDRNRGKTELPARSRRRLG